MKSWTDEPVFTVEPIEGWVPTTLLLGLPDTPETLSPAPSSAVVAWVTVSSRTLGTCTVGGPVETLTVTAEPYGAGDPLAGDVEMTFPDGTVALDSEFCVAVRPTAVSAAWAWVNE